MTESLEPKLFRTSTKIAHNLKRPQTTGYEQIKKIPKCPLVLQSLLEDPMLHDDVMSEMKRQYTFKADESYTLRNPVVNKLNFMKPFSDAKLTFISRNIIPQRSTSHNDFSARRLDIPEPEPIKLPTFPSAIPVKPLGVDYKSHASVKYLDPSATTYKLSYPHYTPAFIENGIARQDNLTFYNWNLTYKPPKSVFPSTDRKVCQEGPAKSCKKRGNEFPSVVKYVPHKGLTTEVKSNYVHPKSHPEFIEQEKPIKQFIINIDPVDPATDTEAMMYGSGNRVEKFV